MLQLGGLRLLDRAEQVLVLGIQPGLYEGHLLAQAGRLGRRLGDLGSTPGQVPFSPRARRPLLLQAPLRSVQFGAQSRRAPASAAALVPCAVLAAPARTVTSSSLMRAAA